MTAELANARVWEWMISSPPVITRRTSVNTALRLAREHSLTALPVCEEGRFVGLVSEKDLISLSPSLATTLDRYELNYVLERLTVNEVLSRPPATVRPEASLAVAATLMVRDAVEVLPVVSGDRLEGLLCWTAVLAAATGEPAFAKAG